MLIHLLSTQFLLEHPPLFRISTWRTNRHLKIHESPPEIPFFHFLSLSYLLLWESPSFQLRQLHPSRSQARDAGPLSSSHTPSHIQQCTSWLPFEAFPDLDHFSSSPRSPLWFPIPVTMHPGSLQQPPNHSPCFLLSRSLCFRGQQSDLMKFVRWCFSTVQNLSVFSLVREKPRSFSLNLHLLNVGSALHLLNLSYHLPHWSPLLSHCSLHSSHTGLPATSRTCARSAHVQGSLYLLFFCLGFSSQPAQCLLLCLQWPSHAQHEWFL